MRGFVAAVLALTALAVPMRARGNGRAPQTNGMHFQPGDPHALYVATTFGLLVSHDDGCTFYWLCEQNIGYGGVFDPKWAIGSDGTIFATTYTGLRVSRDGGCSFATAGASVWVDALDLGPTGEVWIGTAESGGSNDVFRSQDNGMTFAARGLASSTVWYKSIKVAASNPMRVYASGYQVAGTLPDGGMMQPTAHVYRTDDDGNSWQEAPLDGVMWGVTPLPMIAAVDPRDPDTLFVISVGANQPSGDLLYRSSDGAMTFTQVLATTDSIRDVVVHDATTVVVATQAGGSFVSSDGGQSFGAMASPPLLACLGQRADGTLIGCGANWTPDFMAVTKSADLGATWQDVWRFVQLAGPLACPDGTAERDTCDLAMWPTIQQQLGTTGPTCGSNVNPVDAPPPNGDPPAKKSGCCDSGSSGAMPLVWAAVVAIALFARGKRRPRRRRDL